MPRTVHCIIVRSKLSTPLTYKAIVDQETAISMLHHTYAEQGMLSWRPGVYEH